MVKNTITEQQIIQVVKLLITNGQALTVATVRQQLGGRGSHSTIYKYLSKWKQQCFKLAINDQKFLEPNTKLVEQQKNLEQAFKKQLSQNEYYASELINAKKTIINLTSANHQLQAAEQQLQQKLAAMTTLTSTLETLYQDLKLAFDSNRNQVMQAQDQVIEERRQEIQTINQASLKVVQQVSFDGHEALMQEKVRTLNSENQVQHLQQEIIQQQIKIGIFNKEVSPPPSLELVTANHEVGAHD